MAKTIFFLFLCWSFSVAGAAGTCLSVHRSEGPPLRPALSVSQMASQRNYRALIEIRRRIWAHRQFGADLLDPILDQYTRLIQNKKNTDLVQKALASLQPEREQLRALNYPFAESEKLLMKYMDLLERFSSVAHFQRNVAENLNVSFFRDFHEILRSGLALVPDVNSTEYKKNVFFYSVPVVNRLVLLGFGLQELVFSPRPADGTMMSPAAYFGHDNGHSFLFAQAINSMPANSKIVKIIRDPRLALQVIEKMDAWPAEEKWVQAAEGALVECLHEGLEFEMLDKGFTVDDIEYLLKDRQDLQDLSRQELAKIVRELNTLFRGIK